MALELVPNVSLPKVDASAPVITMDGLTNVITGMGTRTDKNAHSRFESFDIPLRYELESMYRTDWVAAKAIDAPTADMVREWRSFEGIDTTKADEIAKLEKRLQLKNTLKFALRWSKLYGGSGILMITGKGTDPMKPLVAGDGQKVERLHVLDRYEMAAYDRIINDPMDENFGFPEFWQVGNRKIHASRIVRIAGRRLPRRVHWTQGDHWGDSELVKIYSAVVNSRTVYDSIASLIHEANVDQLEVEGLMNLIGDCQGEQQVIKRLQLLKLGKSIHNMALLDTNETLTTKTINFSAFGNILYDYITAVAGAVDIPLTRFLGVSPGGLQATGESDLNNYYDRLKSEQEAELNPILDVIDAHILPMVLSDTEMNDATYEHNPLRQESKKDKSDRAKVNADMDSAYSDLLPDSVILRRVQAEGIYTVTDEYIEEVEAIENEADDDLDDGKTAEELAAELLNGGPDDDNDDPDDDDDDDEDED